MMAGTIEDVREKGGHAGKGLLKHAQAAATAPHPGPSCLFVEIVSQDRVVYPGDVDVALALGTGGEMGILPHHAPVLTTLKYGVVKVRRLGAEQLPSPGA